MVRVMQDVEIPARTHKQLHHLQCDLCGCNSRVWSEDWKPGSSYEVSTTTVEMTEGFHFPEGASTKTTGFDICVGCFETKLIPWMASQGAKPTVKED